MNEIEKILKDKFNAQFIGIDDPFMFNCTMCGKCCRNREDIILTPKDIFGIAKELDKPIMDFVKGYCDVYIGNSSKVPIIKLQSIGLDKRCPLLKGNRCSVHSVKPTVCAMFPIGRSLSYEGKNPNEPNFTTNDIKYIFTAPNCGDKRKIHTVREWLKDFNLPAEDEYFIKWNQLIAALSMYINKNEKKVTKEKIEGIQKLFFKIMYFFYDFEKEFFPQFVANSEMFLEKLSALKSEGN